MVAWQILAVVGIVCLILEMVAPAMFFLNFATSAFLTAVCSLFITDWMWLTFIFIVLSLISLFWLRPLLMKKTKKSQETGMAGKYIGKTAKVVETVTSDSGVISIYDERWEARSDVEIPVGAKVQIEKNESLIMYVKEIK